jgi:hypothetical protein
MNDTSPGEDFARNENNQGLNTEVARAQAEADRWFSEIARAATTAQFRLPVEDRLDIIELTGLWDASYDALDREFWLSCLTEDFVFASRGFGEFVGREAMAGYFDTYRKVFHGLRHILSNHVVVGQTATTARGYCYLTVFERIEGTAMVGTSPFYDQYVKQDGRWLFKRRDQVVDPGMTKTPAGQRLMAGFAEVFGQQAAE